MSSWVLVTAAAWPGDVERVVLEADISGGVLGSRYEVAVNPGVISLLSEVRTQPHAGVRLDLHGRRLGSNLWCVPGPQTAEAAGPVWSGGASALAAALPVERRLWLVDCGRVYPNSAVSPILAASDLQIIFCGADTASLVVVPSRLEWLGEHGPVGVVVVGKSGRSRTELSNFFGTKLVWEVDWIQNLSTLAGQMPSNNRARRSKAWREGLDLATDFAAAIEHYSAAPPPFPPPTTGQSLGEVSGG